jgi:hypothetical protein
MFAVPGQGRGNGLMECWSDGLMIVTEFISL